METKICRECGRELPISEFNKNRSSKDGLQDRCRKCFSEYNKKRYASNREKFKANVKRYREDNPEKVLETRLKTNKNNPTKVNARKCVESAIEAGVIKKPHVCSGCGCPDTKRRIEAHHADYEDPLNVIWLCPKCHWRMDERRRVEESGIDDIDGRSIRRGFSDAEDEIIVKRYDAIGVTGLSELLGRKPHSIYTRWKKLAPSLSSSKVPN